MSLLVESIKILDGDAYNIDLHQKRFDKTRKEIYNESSLNLLQHIEIPDGFGCGLVKCRVLYDRKIHSISFSPYEIRKVEKVKLVLDDTISYRHKTLDRPQLDTLYEMKEDCDEIMIIKNNLVTDAYFYNYVFEKNNQYFTPKLPLLEGTMRQHLLNTSQITAVDINVNEIMNFDNIHLINALTQLGEITLKPYQIIC